MKLISFILVSKELLQKLVDELLPGFKSGHR